MITPFLAFKIAFMAGLGLTLGYFIVNITTSLVLAKIQAHVMKKLAEKQVKLAKAAQVKQPKTKLCMKCKNNPRPDSGLYCADCQFSGGHKFT